MRIKKTGRRFDKAQRGMSASTTHRICMGWDIREKEAGRAKPQRLAGFIVARDSSDPDGGRVIDMVCMKRLGFGDKGNIEKAIRGGIKAPNGLIPTTLDFALCNDAIFRDGDWQFPGTFNEQYLCMGTIGVFCSGNGETASRDAGDYTRKTVACHPIGKAGISADLFCPYSAKKQCKANEGLALFLQYVDGDGKWHPLSDVVNARFRIQTTSDNAGVRIAEALEQAAERLKIEREDGSVGAWLAGLNGTLIVNVQRKRYGGGDDGKTAQVGITPQLHIALNESQIRAREQYLREMRMKDRMIAASPEKAAALIDAPVDAPEETDFTLGPVDADDGECDDASTPIETTVAPHADAAVSEEEFKPEFADEPSGAAPNGEKDAAPPDQVDMVVDVMEPVELIEALKAEIKATAERTKSHAATIFKEYCSPPAGVKFVADLDPAVRKSALKKLMRENHATSAETAGAGAEK